MKANKINPLGFLSLLALLSLLSFFSGNRSFTGFLGFLYYLRYFWVIPDELFLQNVRRAAMAAFFSQLIALVPLAFGCAVYNQSVSGGFPDALALSWAVGVFVFSIYLAVLELRESGGAADD